MKRFVPILALVLAFSLTTFAQNSPTNSPQFTLNFNVLNGPLASTGVDFGATYGVTANYWLRADNLIFPAANGEYFGVGLQRTIPAVCDLLANTNINCEKFQPYFGASGGVTRVTVGTAPSVQHGAGMFDVGTNYDPTGTGKFTIGLFEVKVARLTGLDTSPLTVMISSGLQLGWGTNHAAMAQNTARRLKRLANERRRMEKLQRAAAGK